MATSTLGSGTLVLAGTTSGTTTVTATAVAGTTTLTLPAATDTLVGKATTDTLTNKTLTGAVMNGTLGATTPSTVAATTLTTSSTVTHNGGTANGVGYLDGSKVLTTGSALVFDGTNLGVGVTPSAWGTYSGIIDLKGNGSVAAFNQSVLMAANAYYNGTNFIYKATTSAGYYQIAGNVHQWNQAASGTAGNAITFTQAMTLDASGNLLVGATAQVGTANALLTLSKGGNTWQTGPISGNTNFYVLNPSDVGVYLANNGTSWTANSDERLKDIIEPITDAANKVSTLRAVIGKYKTDEEGTRRSFLIAQDVQSVFPEAVDSADPDKLGVQYTEVIPLLVAAIKEQQAIITQLQADVAALKGA
jgi:hypothetical protein